MKNPTKDNPITFGNQVIKENVKNADMKTEWIKQARSFLDGLEKNDALDIKCGMLIVSGFDNIGPTLPEGLSDHAREVLLADARTIVKLHGASIGSYPELIKAVVQTGLGMAPQALANHRHMECKHDGDCDLNEENCIAIPAGDMLMDLMAVTVGSMPLDAATAVVKLMTEKFPLIRQEFVERMQREDPDGFKKAVDKAQLPDSIKEAIANGDLSGLTGAGDASKFRVITGAAVVGPMLRAALDAGAVPEEDRAELEKALERIESESGDTPPTELPSGTTFVPGSKTTKKH